jgi:hypothetical protein
MLNRLKASGVGRAEIFFCLPLFLTGENGLYNARGAVGSTTRGLESSDEGRESRFWGVDGGPGCVSAAVAAALDSFLYSLYFSAS